MTSSLFNRIKRHALWGIIVLAAGGAVPVQAFDPAPSTVQFTFEGCRNDGDPTLLADRNSLPNDDGNYTCQDPNALGGADTPYTSGNLGKGWDELDLVPFRLIAVNGDSAGVVTYDIRVAADNQDNGNAGYDQIVDVQIIGGGLDNDFSDASCTLVSVGAPVVTNQVTGGADDVVYRELRISQGPNTTCVIDWANRLAIGASQYPGSSLQAYIFEQEGFQQGRRTITIDVDENQAFGVRKDMAATVGDGIVWNMTKQATPTTLNLGNTCDTTQENSAAATIRVEWSVIPTSGDTVRVVTNIYVANNLSREVVVDITDEIFGDIGSGEESLDVATFNGVSVPANSEVFVTHTFEAPLGVSGLNDVATATFKDPALPGIPAFPGQPLTTQFDLVQDGAGIQQVSGELTTATVSDTERLTGTGLSYFVSQVTGATGTFSGSYQLNTPLTPSDPDLVWTSETQQPGECADPNGCAVGFVEFTKTISAAAVTSTTGTLADWALLTASDGSMVESGTEQSPVQVTVTSSILVDLDVRLAVPALVAPDTLQCTVEVKNSSNELIETLTYDFDSTSNDVTQTIDDIAPDVYTAEVTSCGSLVGDTVKMVDLTLPAEPTLANCSGELAFELVEPEPPAPVLAAVDKITMPSGEENGWTMTLRGPNTGDNGIVLVTSDSTPGAYEVFQGQSGDFELVAGDYTITETVRDGWVQTASSGCEFTVTLPEDEGTTKQCSFTNKKRGTIIIHKLTKPKYGTGFSFSQNIEGSDDFMLDHGQSKVFEGVIPGSYRVTEIDPAPDFMLVDLVCTESEMANTQTNTLTRQVDIVLDPGETVECTYTNRENGMVKVKKLTNGYPTDDEWKFTLSGPGVNTYIVTPPNMFDFGGIKLIPYEKYTLCEVDIPYGWQSFWMVDTNGDHYADEKLRFENSSNDAPIDYYLKVSKLFNPDYGNMQSIYEDMSLCVNFMVRPGQTLFFQVDNRLVKKTEPVACYDKPIYGGYLTSEDLEANTYMLGGYHVDTCEEATEVLDKYASFGSADYLAAKLFSAKLHEQYGLTSCQQAQTVMQQSHSMLEQSGYSSYGYQPSRWSSWDANNLVRDLDTYMSGYMCR
ncbi:hypothetical protein RJ45_08000 [Photobacterium gaetbulicola]|uniref:SpaA-like prealbumin fold domain-containing protein n=1 Tax=Photobacterium gaetbulicola TaxID=1295392 RepID=A0A0B9G698_9GAMM|nr:hypothetical protein [Photobacterium gaetbulicola]KHT64203.1 hypothetical protein RJ45_08000 [Photobacterium gaetbulicola]